MKRLIAFLLMASVAHAAGSLASNFQASDNGSAALPAFRFSGDPDNGIYRIGANNLGVSLGGSKVIDWSTAGMAVTGTISSTSSVTVGSAGTGTSAFSVNIRGQSGAGGGGYASFIRNVTTIGYVGSYAAISAGGTSSDLALWGTANLHMVAGSADVGLWSSTGLAVTGALSATGTVSTTGTSQSFAATGATTSSRYIQFANTGNSGVFLGAENSVGGSFGATAYDGIVQSAAGTGLSTLIAGTGVVTRVSSTGLAVTGIHTVSGNAMVGGVTDKTTTFGGGGTGLTIQAATAPNLAIWDTTNAGYVSYFAQSDTNAYLYNTASGSLFIGANNATVAAVSSTGLAVTGNVSITSSLIVASQTPASAAGTGVAGTMAWDTNYLYVAVATNTWKRVAIATW